MYTAIHSHVTFPNQLWSFQDYHSLHPKLSKFNPETTAHSVRFSRTIRSAGAGNILGIMELESRKTQLGKGGGASENKRKIK